MKTFSAICLALLAGGLSASAQGQEKEIEVIVENPWNAEKIDAVSYTHLTLPTTCRGCRSRWSPYH